MFIQKTEWGQVTWLHNSDENDLGQSLDFGITTVLPGKRIHPHIHYGHEQILYILNGQGYYYINGEKTEYKKGMHFYIPVDSSHETIPTGDEPTNELMVSNPVFGNLDIHFSSKTENQHSIREKNILYAAVEAIQSHISAYPFAPITIFDNAWKIISEGGEFSEFCNQKCQASKNRKNCACLKPLELSGIEYTKNMRFQCPFGMSVIQTQIVYNNRALGNIRGGHVFLTEPETKEFNLYVMPAATFYSIQRKLSKIADSIVKFCNFDAARHELMEKDEIIRSARTDHIQLEQNLLVAQENVTNLKINHHFLFNTLNCMASMALTSENESLYGAIIDLSKMFRYTMATNLRFAPFSAELEYLGTYINLQKLRYGNCLKVTFDIPLPLYNLMMPFNFLQPIVENAFTHGFESEVKEKRVAIRARQSGKYIKIDVFNNGNHFDKITLNRVRRSLENNTGHGLSLIYAKLYSAYKTDFIMDIISNEKDGTTVSVMLPTNRDLEK